MKDLKRTLTKIGLTEGESQVYEALIELGSTTAGKIIKKAKIASSKVYDVLFRLQTKGLVNHTIQNGVKHYDATPPERLIDFLENKKDEISEAQTEIKKIIPLIEQRQKEKGKTNKTIIYTGKQGPKIVLKETIDAGRRGEELLGYGTDEDPYKEHLPADIEEHFRDQKKYDVKWKLLFTKGEWKSPSPLAEIRYLPKGFNMPVRTMIYGHKVAIVDFTDEITTIIIDKKEIAEAYKKHFRYLWRIAKK